LCEGGWHARAIHTRWLESRQGLTPWPSDLPYGEQVLVFSPLPEAASNQAVAIYISEDDIVHAQNGCRRVDQFIEGATVHWRASS
jgi:hypothetical protein